MGLSERLRRLDSRVFTGTRQPGESAEAFLRRAMNNRRQPGGLLIATDMIPALREHFAALDRERNAR